MGKKVSEGTLTWEEVRYIAKNGKGLDRSAAVQLLQTIELPDVADFEEAADGGKKLSDLRKAGIDTLAVKKIKVKRREIPQGEGQDPVIEIEREIELHNRNGEAFDRVTDRTEGKPAQVVTGANGGPVEAVVKVIRGVSMEDL